MSHLFISYSRRDKSFARPLAERLESGKRDVWIDLEDIPPSAEWLEEIRIAIEGAAAFVFLISPESAASAVCREELEMAFKFGKRVIPVLVRPTEPRAVPSRLASLQWIESTTARRLDEAYGELLEAIDTDLDWVRIHTRLLRRAREWESAGLNESFLLRGKDLLAVEAALGDKTEREPTMTALQLRYVSAGKAFEKKRTRRLVAGLSIGLAVAIGLSVLAVAQWKQARARLITNYWEEGRRARGEGRLLEAVHWMAEAIEVEPRSDLAQRIYVDLRPHLSRARLERRCNAPGVSMPFPTIDRLLVQAGSTRIVDTATCDTLMENEAGLVFTARDMDRAVIASGNDDSLFKVEYLDAEALRSISYQLQGYPVSLNGIRLSSDPSIFAGLFYEDSEEVRIWHVDGDRLYFDSIAEPDNELFDGINFSADGSTLLVWGDAFHLYEVATLAPIRSGFGTAFRVADAAMSPDRRWILSIDDREMSTLWSVATGEPVATSPNLPVPLDGTCANSGLDLQWLGAGTVSLGRDCGGRELALEINLEVPRAEGDSSRERLLTIDEETRSWFSDVAHHQRQLDPLMPGGAASWYLHQERAAGSTTQGTLQIWKIASRAGEPIAHRPTASHDRRASRPPVPPNQDLAPRFRESGSARSAEHGRAFLNWLADGVELWTQIGGKVVSTSVGGSWIGATLGLDGETALTWSHDRVSVWSPDGKLRASLELDGQGTDGAAAIPGRAALVTWGDMSAMQVWDYGSGATTLRRLRPSASAEVEGPVYGVELSPDGKWLMTWTRGWDDGYRAGVRVWNLEAGRQQLDVPAVRRGTFAPRSNRLYVWGWQGLEEWDLDDGELKRAGLIEGLKEIHGALFSDDGERCLVWLENRAFVWDMSSRRQIGPDLVPPHAIDGALLSPDSRFVVLWGEHSASLWEVEGGRPIASTFDSGVGLCGMFFSDDGSEILVLECDGTIVRWQVRGDMDLPLETLRLQVRVLTGMRLHPAERVLGDIPDEELEPLRAEWLSAARQHAESCRYRDRNTYSRWFSEE